MTNRIPPGVLDENSKLRLLGDIVERINLGTSLQEVVDLVFDRLSGVLPYQRVGVAVVDERREKLVLLAARSSAPLAMMPGFAAPIAGSSLEPLLREGRTRILNDLVEYAAAHPASASTQLILKEGMRSSLTLPLLVRGRAVGVIFFSSRQAHAYRPEHEDYLRGVAGHIAIAVERSRLTDALRERTAFLENVLNGSEDAIVVCDTRSRVLSWNRGAEKMFGTPGSEVVGHPFERFLPPDLRERRELEWIDEQVRQHGYLKNYDTRRITREGRVLSVDLTSTALRDSAGRYIGRSSILRDVTEVRRLQEQLAQAQHLAAIGELAATIAHEVKNPLAGISGAIQVLQHAIPDSDPRREIIPEVLGQIGRLDRTVRDLLLFARPTVLQLRDVDLAESLRHAWSLIAQEEKGAEFPLDLEGNAARVRADPDLLQQVWINLFQNAKEAMGRPGRVRVRIEENGKAQVEISDEGPGIAKEHLARLFRPFFTTKTRGTGLGLAISRKIVEAHGGAIRVDSRPGSGARVTVELPR